MYREAEVQALVEGAAAKGATYLDDHEPGWLFKVDVAQLDLSSSFFCILGQAFGEYDEGLDVICPIGVSQPNAFFQPGSEEISRTRTDWSSEHGFTLPKGVDQILNGQNRAEANDAWRLLDEAWIYEIKTRLDAGVTI